MTRQPTIARAAASPWFYVIVGVATIASGIAAVFGSPFTGDGTADGGATPFVTEPPMSASAAPTGSPATREVRPGDCLDTSGRTVVCTSAHRHEVVASAGTACTAREAIRYLGGHVARDVLLVPPTTVTLPDGAKACAVTDPLGETTYVSAKGVLATSGSARWRRCLDEQVDDANMPCSLPHTAEFIGVDSPAADAAGCRRAAEAYMNVAPERVSEWVAVVVVPARDVDDGQPRCAVRALGNAVLTDTLRDIGARTLPISARE